MPLRDRPIKYDGPSYPAPNRDLLQYPGVKEWPPLYNTDNVEKRTVEPQQNATDGKDTRKLPFREEEGVCSNCGWSGVRQDPKELDHYCQDCGAVMPGHTLVENIGNRHETVEEGFGQDARFPDSDKNGAIHTEMMYENVRKGQKKEVWQMMPNSKEYSELSINELDKIAFGFVPDEVVKLMPGQIGIKWKDDHKNVLAEIEDSSKSPKEWAADIDLSEPIDVIFEGGKFLVDDGHHRWNAARILNRPLNVNVEIKDNPYPTIIKKAIESGKPVPEEVMAWFQHRTGQAYNSGPGNDWQKPKLNKLDPYDLFEKNFNSNPDGTAPLKGAGFGLLYGNPHKDNVRVNNPAKITDRSKHLREHMEGVQ